MSLKQQLLLVSLLTLMLPWAGCQFIRETESALRASQQQMLAGNARAIADNLSANAQLFPPGAEDVSEQLYVHELEVTPVIDGYVDDWNLDTSALRTFETSDGEVRVALGSAGGSLYLYVHVEDDVVVYASPAAVSGQVQNADTLQVLSATPPYTADTYSFIAEAPGPVVPIKANDYGVAPEPGVRAFWQDVPRGYRVEARFLRARLGTHLGLLLRNTASPEDSGNLFRTFSGDEPGRLAGHSGALTQAAENLVQQGMRLIITDNAGWRLAEAGNLQPAEATRAEGTARWLRYAYDAVVDAGTPAGFAEPATGGREQQPYIQSALAGTPDEAWFRSTGSGRAVVAVAEPVMQDGTPVGAVILQQGTDAILSLTNQGLARLLNLTLLAVLVVAGALLGYATWISRRIRRLSVAAVDALDHDRLGADLPSAKSADEIGDLSRSFSSVLAQLGEYNAYLRTLASKLSHELRTPLAIVTSSLDNLEHESLTEAAAGYTGRARAGADRLRRILSAMSEASRVEELMVSADMELFAPGTVVNAAVNAYRDVYPDRDFALDVEDDIAAVHGSPELLVQLLDKLVDNAVSFSTNGDEISIAISGDRDFVRLDVTNPGPPLPERMHGQLFDSMVSVRPGDDDTHLGLGLHVARLIAEGHNGRIEAGDIDGGVRFSVWLPVAARREGDRGRIAG